MSIRTGIMSFALAGAVVAAAQPSTAADLGGYKDITGYVPINWTGFYGGINGGVGTSGNNQLSDPYDPFGGVAPSGGFAGGQLGYNWQTSSFVLGLETDLEGAGIQDNRWDAYTHPYQFTSSLTDFGSVRARAGFAISGALIYATGGYGFGTLTKTTTDGGHQTFSGLASGFVAGGGIEYLINPSWSVKAEYQYLDLGKNDAAGSGNTFSEWAGPQKDDDYHTVRVGVNYHFNSGVFPLK